MSSEHDDEPSAEDLDVSMTQSPLVLFIPYNLAIILGAGTFALGTFFQTFKVFFAGPILWTLAAVWIKRDAKAIDVLQVNLRLIALWLTAYPWGGWSVNPPGHRSVKRQMELTDAAA